MHCQKFLSEYSICFFRFTALFAAHNITAEDEKQKPAEMDRLSGCIEFTP